MHRGGAAAATRIRVARLRYVSNAELGFDYLRDQLALDESELVLPKRADGGIEGLFWWCLVDEADSILIDEARTPLILSETTDPPCGKYAVSKDLAEAVLTNGVHYDVDEKSKAVTLTEAGSGRRADVSPTDRGDAAAADSSRRRGRGERRG